MRKKFFSIFVTLCMVLGMVSQTTTVSAATPEKAKNVVMNGNVIEFDYDTATEPTVVRFDISFYAGTSDKTLGNVYIAWAKANTGTSAEHTSKGATITKTGTVFHVTIDLSIMEPWDGKSYNTADLTAPNTHLWMTISPCNSGVSMGTAYISSHYLSNFESWDSLVAGDFFIGTDDYKTLDLALSAATTGDTIEMKANPKSEVTGTLKDGVTLQDTTGKKYLAYGSEASIKVDTSGVVSVLGTGTGKVHASSGATTNVKASDGTMKTVSSTTAGGYDVVVPTTGDAYVTGIPGESAIAMDNVIFFAPGATTETTGKIYLPDPLDSADGSNHAMISANTAGSLKVSGGKVISTDGTSNGKAIDIKKEADGTIVTLPAGSKVTIDGKVYENNGTEDLLINVELESYKTEKAAETNAKHVADELPAVKTLIDEAEKAIKDYVYDDSKTLAENKVAVDALVEQLDKDVDLALDKDAFDSYKTEKATEVNGKQEMGELTAVRDFINLAEKAINDYVYDDSKTLEQNKAAVDALVVQLDKDVALTTDKNAFDIYKTEKENKLNDLMNVALNDDMKDMIKRSVDEITKTDYDTTKNLTDNKVVIDGLINQLNQAIKASMPTPEKPTIIGSTASSITIDAEQGVEYSIDGGATWVKAEKACAMTFKNLQKGTKYNVLARTAATDQMPASETADKEVLTSSKSAKELADMFKDDADTSVTTGSGKSEQATNETVEVVVDETGNYKVTLKKDVNKTVVLPDNAGMLTVDLNGNDIIGETGNDGILIVSDDGIKATTDLMLTGKGNVLGGDATASGNGGNGIAIASDAASPMIRVDSEVSVLGGNGGNGTEANTSAGNGGSGIAGSAEVLVNGGKVIGGMGGTAIKDGIAGNGGSGITTDKAVTVLNDAEVLGGNGGDAETGNAGNGGNGVDGTVAINEGTLTGGNGGNSAKGNGGNGGNSATVVQTNDGRTNGGVGGNGTQNGIGGDKNENDGINYLNVFEAYRHVVTEQAANKHTDGESEAMKAIINSAEKAIADYKYDTEKTLEENQAALDALIAQLDKDIETQKEKESKAAITPAQTPNTGDYSNTMLWTTLFTLAGGAFIYMNRDAKRRKSDTK